MKDPVLVIMAAGMGSRYGGLKQIDPIDSQGHMIIDYSIYDAIRAGFKRVVFIIKQENHKLFEETIGSRIAGQIQVDYVYQKLENIPDGFQVPQERKKPWGTGHAILSCIDTVDAPFAVINADDFYGREAFARIYRYLTENPDGDTYKYAMVGYALKNTLTENGSVARGICTIDGSGNLQSVFERTHIENRPSGPAYTEDGEQFQPIAEDSVVSLNMWGFQPSILTELKQGFAAFLQQGLQSAPLTCEYFIPTVVQRLLDEQKAEVKVLETPDKWYGVTYKEDKPMVEQAIADMKEQGIYPDMLWK